MPFVKRWCPRFPLAHEIWVIPYVADPEEGMLLESAAGLASRAALHSHWRTFLYENLDNDSYRRAFAAYCKAHSPRVLSRTLDEAITRLHRVGIVKGYLLYRYEASVRTFNSLGALDESANVATALAARQSGLVVSERLAPRLERLGVKRLRDVRGMTEARCWQQEGRSFSPEVLGTCDPKARNARSLMIALDAFVCSGQGDVYRQAMAHCRPDSPILGWGCGPEDAQTIASSQWGMYQTSTNWCHNLPALASESVGATLPARRLQAPAVRHWTDLDWGDGRHYATFVMSDGDNVQWIMGNFESGSDGPFYYANPQRGKIPFGWGLPIPSLVQLAPRMLEDVFARATPNDDFLLYHGGGYFYPDLYGTKPGRASALTLHAERLHGYIELTDVRTLVCNFQKWDSPEAHAAWRQWPHTCRDSRASSPFNTIRMPRATGQFTG